MKVQHRHACKIRSLVITALVGSVLAGCNVVGPSSIRGGRLAYNEAINDTNNQQMLMMIVHNRYEERGNMLMVGSVTANIRISSGVDVQAGFGNDRDYSGNLVPFSGAFIYEENPTISYVPVTGVEYLRQLTMPLPMFLLAQMADSRPDPATAYTMLISSVNRITNADFLFTPQQQPDPRFNRFVEIMTELTQAHRLHWVADAQDKQKFALVIDHSADGNQENVRELLDIVGLPIPSDKEPDLIIPVSMALDGASAGALGITTRSVWDMVEILSSATDVPPADELEGVSTVYPRKGAVGKDLRIQFSQSEPERAYVSVKHRSGWFYIDERDHATKSYFKLLGALWSSAMSSSAGATAAPVLTVPVSR